MSAFLVAWTNWVHDPVIAVALLVLAALYVEGFARADPRIVAPARTAPRIGAFIVGLLTATLAMVSPLDTLGGQFFAAHMLQHLVLIMVVAPLLAWSRADVILSHSLPVSARRWLARYRAISGVKTWTNSPRTAWLVAAVFTGTIWLWHIPAAHDAALGNAGLHVLEHFMVLGSATLFWRVIIGSDEFKLGPAGAAIIVSLVSLQGSLLSAILMFAPRQLCGAYAGNPIEDQVLAGLLMCIPASFVYLGSTVWVLSRLIGEKRSHAG